MPEAAAEPTPLRRARLAAGMSQGDVRAKLKDARKRRRKMPPKDASLKRMYTEWEQGRVIPADWRDELCEVFELPPAVLGFVDATPPSELAVPSALSLTRLDPEIVELLEAQTDHYRHMDRKLGAALRPQTEAHVEHMQGLLRTALPGQHHAAAAVALAEGAALAGWQALDAGDLSKAWELHDVAKGAAKEGDDPASWAHVTAQQAYALLDANRPADAVELVRYANAPATATQVPPRLRAWLAAAEAEFLSAAGQRSEALRMLDNATEALPPGDSDPDLPFLMLNHAHLSRWRGHCLARLGEKQAVDDLTEALDGSGNYSSGRAQTGVHVDLALALRRRGDVVESQEHATRAAELAGTTGSARQRARIANLLTL